MKGCIKYKEHCKEDNGPLKLFWNSYLEMVELLMNFVRATREGNWDLHLECIKEMLPWVFPFDHTNYARYLPVYLAQMMVLPETHPEAHALLLNGDFGVPRATSHGFAQMPVGQTIEQTLNRSTKTKGGIVGFSLRKGCCSSVDDYCSSPCFFRRQVPENDNGCSRKPMQTAQGNKLRSHKKSRGRRRERV